MAMLLKLVIVVVTVAALGAGGYMVYQRQTVEVRVQPAAAALPSASEVERMRKGHGDIDKLPPVTLPDNRTPAQKAADPTNR